MSDIVIINPDNFLKTDSGRVWTKERNEQAWNIVPEEAVRNVFEQFEAPSKEDGFQDVIVVDA